MITLRLTFKLFCMTHRISRKVVTDDSLVFYRTFAKLTGRQLKRSLRGYKLV